MVQLKNFFSFITSMVVPRGTAAPVLLEFVIRDVPTDAPSSNGTIILIPIPSFPFLAYIRSKRFIRSMDGAKKSFRGVLRLLFFRTPLFFLPHDRSAKRERGRRRKGQRLRPNGNEQRRNDKMRCPGPPPFRKKGRRFWACSVPRPPFVGWCLCLTMFPEKRYSRETTSTTEVAIHTNPFMDPYAPIVTGSFGRGGYLLCQLQKENLHWNRESPVEFIIALNK
ncbi:hypothetical protein AMTRI_Chr08g162340 [Amborella trichopoda]